MTGKISRQCIAQKGDRMSHAVIGYVLAIVSSLFHTLYIIPRKISKQSPVLYILYMSIGFVGSSAAICAAYAAAGHKLRLFEPVLGYAAAAGVLSMVASLCVVRAIDEIGMSRSNQWKNLQGPIGAALIFIFFHEAHSTRIPFLILAVVAIFASAMFLNIRKSGSEPSHKRGIIYALGAAVFYGVNAMLRKYTSDADLILEQQLWSSIFMLISAGAFVLIKHEKRPADATRHDDVLATAAGVIYYFATYFFITAYEYIQGSIAYTIVQLNTVFTVVCGILIFHEISFRKNAGRVLAGVGTSVVGMVMLMAAQK